MSDTISITRAERDLLHDHVQYWVGLLAGDSLERSRDEVLAAIDKLQRAVVFYDELGWDEDDPRQAFTITIDPGLAQVLHNLIEDSRTDREREIEYRETHILGLRPTRYGTTWSDDYRTIEEAHAAVERRIEDSDKEERMAEELLRRMGFGALIA
jgi:hypothetical protein